MGNTQATIRFDDGSQEVTIESGETLSDITQFYGPGMLRNLDNGSTFFAQDKMIPAGRYTFIRKKVQVVGYEVRAFIMGAKSCVGARRNIYKLLERHHGGYSQAEGHGVTYSSNDLDIKAYFKSYDNACDFQSELYFWELNKDLVYLDGVKAFPQEPLETPLPSDFQRFRQLDYHPSTSESPCADLDMLSRSFRISTPVVEEVERNSPLDLYQSVDMRYPGLNHYRWYIFDKFKNMTYQNNENNMIAASWQFHQMMDGVNTSEGIPLLRLSFKSFSTERKSDKDNRYKVVLGIEFKDETSAGYLFRWEKARRVDEKNWEVTVFVRDKVIFAKCVNRKYIDTTRKWILYDQRRNRE